MAQREQRGQRVRTAWKTQETQDSCGVQDARSAQAASDTQDAHVVQDAHVAQGAPNARAVRGTQTFLRAHVSSWGYACFLTVNATSIWGGVFPFLPLEFQTAEVTLTFFLLRAGAFLRRRVRCEHVGVVLLSARRSQDAGAAFRRACVPWLCMPSGGDVYRSRHAGFGRRWRGVSGCGLCGHVHALAALFRLARPRTGEYAAHGGNGTCSVHLFRAVSCAHRLDGVSRPSCIRAAVRLVRGAFCSRDAGEPAHVRRRAARASACVSAGRVRLLAQRPVRRVAGVRKRGHSGNGCAACRYPHLGEQRFHVGFFGFGGGASCFVAAHELPLRALLGVSRSVSCPRDGVSASALLGVLVSKSVRGGGVYGILARADAHDDAVRSGFRATAA